MQDVVKLVVNGLELQIFESFELKNSMSSATTDFSFTYAPKSKIINGQYVLIDLIKPQDPVLIFINDIKYLTGYVVSTEWSEGANSDLITVQGMDAVSYCLLRHYPRPKTYKIKDFTALVRMAVEDNGFADIITVQNITFKALPIDTQEQIQIEDGETLFNFFDKYAKKAQVLLNTTGTGELIIYREGDLGTLNGKFPNKPKAGVALINDVIDKRKTNMLSSTFSYSVLNRFQVVEIYSQSGNANHNVKNANPKSIAKDEQIIIANRLRVGANNPTNSTTLEEMAKWNVNIKRSQSVNYSCTVQGFSFSPTNKDFWKINTYVEVLDNKKGFNGEFLIDSVVFTKDTNGTTTQLNIVNKGTYTLDIKQALTKARVNNFGNQFQS